MQKRSWTRSWPALGDHVGVGVVREQPDDRAARASQSFGGTSRPADAVLDHLRDAAHLGRDDRPAERHRLEDAEALGLPVRRQDGDVQRRGDRRDVLATAGEDDPAADAERRGLGLERVPLGAFADDQQPGLRDGRPARAARRRSACDGPSRPRGEPRRRRSASPRGSSTPRGACSRAAGGCSAGDRRRCRSG